MTGRSAEIDAPREWLRRECPECHARPNYACRDEDGFYTDTHAARVTPPGAPS